MTALDKIMLTLIDAIDRQTAVLEGLPESIGKSVAQWLVKTNLPNIRNELLEVALADLGFQPVEIVDLVYPNLDNSKRRTKAKGISKRLQK